MSSEVIVVIALVALAILGLVYLQLHSRRNEKSAEADARNDSAKGIGTE